MGGRRSLVSIHRSQTLLYYRKQNTIPQNIIHRNFLPKLVKTSNTVARRIGVQSHKGSPRKLPRTMSWDQASARLKHSIWKYSWTPAGSWALLKNKSGRRTAKCVLAYVLSSSGQNIINFTSCALSSDRIPHHITSHLLCVYWGKATGPLWKQNCTRSLHAPCSHPSLPNACQVANWRNEGGSWQARAGLCQSSVRLKMWLWTIAIM